VLQAQARAPVQASQWVQASAVPEALQPQAEAEAVASVLGAPLEAVQAEWEQAELASDARPAVGLPVSGTVPARAAAGPRPEAATAASELRAAGAPRAVPDASEAVARAESDGLVPEVQAMAPVHAAEQPLAVARSDVRALQEVRRAARPADAVAVARQAAPSAILSVVAWATPSAAASVFRQARPRLVAAGPERRRQARTAHAMLTLQTASR
jgi:hypothetical protein